MHWGSKIIKTQSIKPAKAFAQQSGVSKMQSAVATHLGLSEF